MPTPYRDKIMTYPLIAHYDLDEASGTVLADSSGQGRHLGSSSSATTYGITGPMPGQGDNKAIRFDEQEFKTGGTGAEATRTLIAWVKTTNTTSSNGQQSVLTGTFFYANGGIYFALQMAAGGYPRASVSGVTATGPTPVSDDLWHMLAMTFADSGGVVKLYVDGVEVASTGGAAIQSLSDRPQIGVAWPTETRAALDSVSFISSTLTAPQVAELWALRVLPENQTVAIGRVSSSRTARIVTPRIASTVPWVGTAPAALDGQRWLKDTGAGGPSPQFAPIGRVTPARTTRPLTSIKGALNKAIGRVSDTRLTRALVVDQQPPLDYYPTEVLSDEPSIYWRFEEGPDVLDYSGNNRHGTFENWENWYTEEYGTTQFVDGAIALGQRFEDCEVYYVDADTYSVTQDFTCEMWIQSENSDPSVLGVVMLMNVGSNQKGIGVQTTSGTTYLYGRWGQVSNSVRPNMVPFSTVNDGEWHHLMLTRAGGEIRFYVDGELAYSLSGEPAYTPNTYTGFSIGSWSPDPAWDPSPAYDEMAYYPYALTPAKAKRHYDSAILLGDPPLDREIPIGRVTSTARLAQPLGRAQARIIAIGRASRSSSARALTLLQGPPPGSPQFQSIGRVSTARTTRSLAPHVLFNQTVSIGRATRNSTARPLTYATGLMYQDTFNRGGPAVGSPTLGGPYSYPYGESFAIDASALRSTSTGTVHITVPTAINFDAEVTVKTVGASAGFAFRYQNGSNYWLLRWTGGDLSLIRRVGSQELGYAGYGAPISAGAKLRVVAWGKILSVYLDGRLIFTAEDYYAPTSTVGFVFTGDTVTRVDEVTVKQAYDPTLISGDNLDDELLALLSEGLDEGRLFKGRDARLADEGAMA